MENESLEQRFEKLEDRLARTERRYRLVVASLGTAILACVSLNGGWREGWSWGRSDGKSGRRTLTRSSGCCGRRNEGRIRGKHWPSYPVDGVEEEVIDG